MKKSSFGLIKLCFAILFAAFLFFQCDQPANEKQSRVIEPQPVTDTYFGVELTDDYRNLENLEDSNVVNWMKAEADHAREIINKISGRQEIIDKLVDFDKRVSSKIYRLSITDNDRYFYLKQTPEDETGKLFFRDGFEGKEQLLYDPESFDTASDKTYVITALYPSDSGEKLAFQIAPDGSEDALLLIMNVEDKSLYSEQIDRCWFASVSWLPGESAFLFNRLQQGDFHDEKRGQDSKTYLHEPGSDPENDRDIFSREKYPDLGIQPEEYPLVIYDKITGYLFGLLLTVDNSLFTYYAPFEELENEKINWQLLFSKEDQVHNFSTSPTDIFIYTPKGAPNFTILKTPVENPGLANAVTVVPEDKSRILQSYKLNKDALYYTMSENGVQEKVFRLSLDDNSVEELKLPFVAGSARISNKNALFTDIWVNISGWTSDFQRYRYLAEKKEFKVETLSDKAEYPEFKNLVVKELMIPSHDGVEVPLSIIYDKKLKKDGQAQVLMHGYGAYGISISPAFSPGRLLVATKGAILAVAHVRGGGELGDSWHKAGYKTTKPNTWKDFIACAEYLINEKYSSSNKIAIMGGSAGGILIGRAVTERPDLFAAAIPIVGSMNTVRGENTPNGPVNAPEFGTVKDSVECMALIEMDSYHHIKKGEKYPSMLITAGMNDPRVIAWQPAKFAARMIEYNASDNPILFLTDFGAGHGIGDTKTKQFETTADLYSFALWQTNLPEFQIN